MGSPTQKFLVVSSSTAPCNGCELHKLAAEDPASSQLKVARWKRGSVGGFTTRHQTISEHPGDKVKSGDGGW